MALIFFAIAALESVNFCSGNHSWIELNPELQQYQDLSKCYPLPVTWYVIYRNFESDPVFGGTAKCLMFTETGPPEDGAYPVLIEYGNQSKHSKSTLESFPGYTAKNILSFTPPTQAIAGYNEYISYVECDKCAVLRNAYMKNSSCSLLVPQSQLNKDVTCCEFIFDLLCGTTPKYYSYDESC